MYITEAVKDNLKEFIDLNDGDVFKYEGNYYMKIYIHSNLNNAVRLNIGEAVHFSDNKLVTLVDYNFIIK